MAQFVTHIQPTLLEASQGHVPHHHGHQVGVQHSSHLPHSGHNMPSPPTAHNHHHHGGHGNSSSHHHQQQSHKQPQSHADSHHAEQPHSKKSHHATGHGNAKSHPHQSPPSAVSSPPGEHVGHYDYFQHQHELAFQHHGDGATPVHGGSNNKHHDKHEHCPTGHQSAVSQRLTSHCALP
ncbi:hypothetical protein KR093_002974 [Drosophila rubida]|uniref:Uncharacterized protein n=1 Tax=Drosophila rubida TaxID=30044 RepID=A0AAD4PJ53_9MUSC|nr:hypothetical protein KR093_002974 [Drosophila rubida]